MIHTQVAKLLYRLTILITVAAVPLLVVMLVRPPAIPDLLFYSISLDSFNSQFWHGEWYPRWLSLPNEGAGSPVFVFYAPLAYWLSCLMGWLTPLDPTGQWRVVASMIASMFASGLAMYLWMREKTSAREASLGGLIYVAIPYRFQIFYFTCGLSKMWALALFPLMLLCVEHITQGRRYAYPMLALVWGALLLMHPASAVVFAPVFGGYFLFFAENRKVKPMLYTALALALGSALSAFYLLPAVLNKPAISYNDYLAQTGGWQKNLYDGLQLEYALLIIVPLAAAIGLARPRARKAFLKKAEHKFWLWMVAFLAFMASPASELVWAIVKPLQYVVFPVRFYGAMVPCVALMLARLLPHCRERLFPYQFLGATLFFFVILGLTIVPTGEVRDKILASRLIAIHEYRTVWTDSDYMDSAHMHELAQKPPVKLLSGDAEFSVERWDARHVTLKIDADKPSELLLRRFYFPGWWAVTTASEGEISFGPALHSGLMKLSLPKGEYELTLLQVLRGEEQGNLITCAAIFVLMVGSYALKRLQRD